MPAWIDQDSTEYLFRCHLIAIRPHPIAGRHALSHPVTGSWNIWSWLRLQSRGATSNRRVQSLDPANVILGESDGVVTYPPNFHSATAAQENERNMNRKYALLRPGPVPPPGSRRSMPLKPEVAHIQKRRRVGTTGACHGCRCRKIRCDGQKPSCQSCLSREEECRYNDDLNQTDGVLVVETIRLLNDRAPEAAANALAALRGVDNAASILSHLRSGDGIDSALTQPYSGLVPTNGNPLYVLQVALELQIQHPFIYPALLPIDVENPGKELRRLVQSCDGDVSSPRGFNKTLTHKDRPSHEKNAIYHVRAELSMASQSLPSTVQSAATPDRLSLEPQPTLYGHRLRGPILGFWTNIPISDEMASQALSLYFKTDHPLLGPFHAEFFIRDLVAHKGAYCSSLLVNALMYWVCQMYSTISPEASDLVDAFCTEAETLWERDCAVPSTVNMAAALFLSFGHLVQGRNGDVLVYISEAVRMGKELGLLGVEHAVAKATAEKMTAEQLKAASHTTWGVFNWNMLMALFYYQSAIDHPLFPPHLSIPEDDDDVLDKGLSPGVESVSPPRYVGSTFPTICRFWRIMHGVAIAYRRERPAPLHNPVSLEFAEFKFRELLAWADNLPPHLARSEQNAHDVVVFHIWLHAAIIDIFRPFLCRPGQAKHKLRTFSSPICSPDDVCTASLDQLKRLIIVYRLNHESSAFTIVWHTAMLYVANAVLRGPDDDHWLFYFLLCIYGYQTLGRRYPVGLAIVRALLSMAMRNGYMSSKSAREIWSEMSGKCPRRVPQQIHASLMADLDLAMSKPNAATVEKLAEAFEENALVDQYTNLFDV
ncbi:N-terminal fungal transcription regulatory domain-containing protein [Dactylonectria estremocensis]|uniref:N-terminal fungal transcription regulatory domain-containing protein n=1 Tax=Dactylonectria estremocensis TaxID=1079267 RepID=A0A9P9JEE7_9HYPO|nr:N-terminal fungal transcription regulatory domain-containing protein [Dactylonectria estremocensis]